MIGDAKITIARRPFGRGESGTRWNEEEKPATPTGACEQQRLLATAREHATIVRAPRYNVESIVHVQQHREVSSASCRKLNITRRL